MRYIIKSGRFGKYFYDTRLKADLDLEKVLSLLNESNNIKSELNEMKVRLERNLELS